MIYALAFRCFSICSSWTNFHHELKNGYSISFINRRFKTFLDQLYLKRPQVLPAEKKILHWLFLFLMNCPFKPEQNFKKFSKEH